MAKIISLLNHKGGVGKTTSCTNIGAGLHRLDKNVLLIDLDPQANLTYHLLGLPSSDKTIYSALRREYPLPVLSFKPGLHKFDMVIAS